MDKNRKNKYMNENELMRINEITKKEIKTMLSPSYPCY